MKKTILIVEDDDSIVYILKTLLSENGYKVIVAQKGLDAIYKVAEADMIILDLGLPDIDGQKVLKSLRKSTQKPVIVLSARHGEDGKVKAFENGADDYVTKPFNPLELVARVKSQLRRYTTLSNNDEDKDTIYEAGGLVINDDLKKVMVDGEEVRLTPIEYNILLLLMKNKGKVYSINQIYESIWNEEAIGADNTVAVHIRHIREKIEINPKDPRYLKVVWGVGYKIEESR